MIEWSEEDNRLAISQGWNLFHVTEAYYTAYIIQRLDDPEAWREEGYTINQTFEEDIKALEFVIKQAALGDQTAWKAILLINRVYYG